MNIQIYSNLRPFLECSIQMRCACHRPLDSPSQGEVLEEATVLSSGDGHQASGAAVCSMDSRWMFQHVLTQLTSHKHNHMVEPPPPAPCTPPACPLGRAEGWMPVCWRPAGGGLLFSDGEPCTRGGFFVTIHFAKKMAVVPYISVFSSLYCELELYRYRYCYRKLLRYCLKCGIGEQASLGTDPIPSHD